MDLLGKCQSQESVLGKKNEAFKKTKIKPGHVLKKTNVTDTIFVAKQLSLIEQLQAHQLLPQSYLHYLVVSKKVSAQMYPHYEAERVGARAPVYLVAVFEYLAAKILEFAGDTAHDNKKFRINPRHLQLAIRNDEELNKLRGVIPNIQSKLVPKKGAETAGNSSVEVQQLTLAFLQNLTCQEAQRNTNQISTVQSFNTQERIFIENSNRVTNVFSQSLTQSNESDGNRNPIEIMNKSATS
uniref:Histone H2A n=1 Tax=Rhabditophanes sp. KR3021 TaxID=114890 RepID=A0AC35TT01_9BILA